MNLGNNTSAEGAAFGAALGAIIVYLAELLSRVDIPAAVEGSIVVVVVYAVARLLPTRERDLNRPG